MLTVLTTHLTAPPSSPASGNLGTGLKHPELPRQKARKEHYPLTVVGFVYGTNDKRADGLFGDHLSGLPFSQLTFRAS